MADRASRTGEPHRRPQTSVGVHTALLPGLGPPGGQTQGCTLPPLRGLRDHSRNPGNTRCKDARRVSNLWGALNAFEARSIHWFISRPLTSPTLAPPESHRTSRHDSVPPPGASGTSVGAVGPTLTRGSVAPTMPPRHCPRIAGASDAQRTSASTRAAWQRHTLSRRPQGITALREPSHVAHYRDSTGKDIPLRASSCRHTP